MAPPMHMGRVGYHSNNFLGINWLKKTKMPYGWGQPYGLSQWTTKRMVGPWRAAAKTGVTFVPFFVCVLLMMVQPTKKGMKEYGTWPFSD